MVDLNNNINAFNDKSNTDLNRAWLLFLTISNPTISKLLTNLLQIAISLKLPINYLVKISIFKQFCGGETITESKKTIDKLWKSKIGSILDYSAEGKQNDSDFKSVYDQGIKILNESENKNYIPFVVFKLTGLINFEILEKKNKNILLDQYEENTYNLFLKRLEQICDKAKEINTPVFIDAEESWIQNAVDEIVLNLMKKYNHENVLIFNTIQMYRNDRVDYLNKIIDIGNKEKFKIGLKIVRGAYHEKEIDRAKKYNYNIPVHLKKEDTDKDFNKALEICVQNIDRISICSGTHNIKSSEYLIKLMKENGIKSNDKRIYSSQLLGMSDNISYNLAKANYNVCKYVPYGPIKEVIPYLIRRAEENRSISGQMSRELSNIIKEKKRRREI
jgi:proline dehydrogenase